MAEQKGEAGIGGTVLRRGASRLGTGWEGRRWPSCFLGTLHLETMGHRMLPQGEAGLNPTGPGAGAKVESGMGTASRK